MATKYPWDHSTDQPFEVYSATKQEDGPPVLKLIERRESAELAKLRVQHMNDLFHHEGVSYHFVNCNEVTDEKAETKSTKTKAKKR